MDQRAYHIPALLPQVIEGLDIFSEGTYVDCTYGGGGHSRAIVNLLSPAGHLYAFDQDIEACERAIEDPRFTIIHGNFRFLTNFLRYCKAPVGEIDGILADLGVSFHHFDDPERGFSFRWDGPLDMRMNQKASLTAAQVVNTYAEEQLADIFYLYGELKQARRLAAEIAKARTTESIDTVEQLLAVCKRHISPKQEKKELAQLFQALRIEVNGELTAIRALLEQSVKALKPGGRLAVITYHSLEDRLVKNFMKTGNCEGKIETDLYGRAEAPMKLLTSKPIVPDDAEIEANPRSRSAKLRIARKS
ncbi:MAG: 16S rRNA (cytosine(1402)-N(4))-methyltransferase RsmH [Bacteroidales bacterium]|nr:16S rRNA (cytosine(1402)-N(4))-methyltransferase RsmH [Bacteroidales bacterium]